MYSQTIGLNDIAKIKLYKTTKIKIIRPYFSDYFVSWERHKAIIDTRSVPIDRIDFLPKESMIQESRNIPASLIKFMMMEDYLQSYG